MTDISREALEFLREQADEASGALGKVTDIGGVPYSTAPLHDVRKFLKPDPLAVPFEVHTLAGLAAYIETNPDGLPVDAMVLHIEGPDVVSLVAPIDPDDYFKQRAVHAVAQSWVEEVEYGHFYPVETMVVLLQARFADSDDRPAVLRAIGNVRSGQVVTRSDDGVTQEATGKKGVALVDDLEIPNPVTLQPFRTFPEIDPQPASKFVLRLRELPHDDVGVALFEADAMRWKLEAIAKIAEWFEGRFGDRVDEMPSILL